MAHDGDPVEGRLAVEEDDVAVHHVTLDRVAHPKVVSRLLAIAVLQELADLGNSGSRSNLAGLWNSCAGLLYVSCCFPPRRPSPTKGPF